MGRAQGWEMASLPGSLWSCRPVQSVAQPTLQKSLLFTGLPTLELHLWLLGSQDLNSQAWLVVLPHLKLPLRHTCLP